MPCEASRTRSPSLTASVGSGTWPMAFAVHDEAHEHQPIGLPVDLRRAERVPYSARDQAEFGHPADRHAAILHRRADFQPLHRLAEIRLEHEPWLEPLPAKNQTIPITSAKPPHDQQPDAQESAPRPVHGGRLQHLAVEERAHHGVRAALAQHARVALGDHPAGFGRRPPRPA